ncbi:transcriptional regulator [Streptomyces sp. NBC_00083]|uniref:transcriptional regulator n=1 Tax=Streptomyces sp. NBC_00083 TaxID=2975647 RepID=UPI0022569062|nr:transcriptional regulator [Streptomyces sp. NBC_00083]MCX5384018.1 transcriptional regulator [Streptomyces sp. NBC_00083]
MTRQTRTAKDIIAAASTALAPSPDDNRLVPLVEAGRAPRSALAGLALEQRHIIAADRRAFLHLAERSGRGTPCAAFFGSLAEGESLALEQLGAYESACGLTAQDIGQYLPRAGCQAYPAYVAWLALNGDPSSVALALTANFAAWGGYCARLAAALRSRYGFTDEACGFFDLFAGPAPELEQQAVAAVAAGSDDAHGEGVGSGAHYGRLLQSYESMFWNTLAP